MTGAERQAKQREKAKDQRALARDAIEFLRYLEPDGVNERRLRALQRRIRSVHPEINIRALDALSN